MERPSTLTPERAFELLPRYKINPEWQRKKDAGELEEGILGMSGMLESIPSSEIPTEEEVNYILYLKEELELTMRGVADEIFGDSNQIFGMEIIEVAEKYRSDKAG